jgi:two-component system LytT family response regulator
VGDEAPARERLKRCLATHEGVEVIGEAKDGVQAVEMIEARSPELVLLDIQMPGLDCIGVVEALEDLPAIISVTAYDQYAIRAFEVHAPDYLLKPFSRERLAKAIHRAREALVEERVLGAQLCPLLEGLVAGGRYLTRLAVRDRESIRVLDAEEKATPVSFHYHTPGNRR